MERYNKPNIKEKLNAIHYAFDEKNWQNMEQLLDKKKKRRILIWWFSSGIAASIFSISLLWFYNPTSNTSDSQPLSQIFTQKQNQATQAQKNDNAELKNIQENKSKTTLLGKVKNKAKLKSTESYTASLKLDESLIKDNRVNLNSMVLDSKIDFLPIKDISESLTIPISEQNESNKKRSPKFRYAIGVLSHLSTNTLNENKANTINFQKSPTYRIGINHEFVFLNRYAITNSILFSKTNYSSSNPMIASQNFSGETANKIYSTITEVALPIGFKYNFIAKEKIMVYGHVGIINHFKLKEKIQLITDEEATITSSPTRAIDEINIDYRNNKSSQILQNKNLPQHNFESAYYASFYTSMGVESKPLNAVSIFAEPTFELGLQKIGYQQKNKMNIGGNLGIRYLIN